MKEVIASFEKPPWDGSRLRALQQFVDFLFQRIKSDEKMELDFICTHNSRRSQFSQIWGATLPDYFDLPIECYSDEVEVSEFNPRAGRCVSERWVFDLQK